MFHCSSNEASKQKSFVSQKLSLYRARFTQDVLDGMRDLTNETTKLNTHVNKKRTVLDIGCNDGSLLNEFKKKGFKTIGVEPTGAAKGCPKETRK